MNRRPFALAKLYSASSSVQSKVPCTASTDRHLPALPGMICQIDRGRGMIARAPVVEMMLAVRLVYEPENFRSKVYD